ncbi:ADP-ribosylglycohydrolase family protein [Actinosynnema sp. NPDC020468]|uniref:ADP-ribosylglycohydrolase family protein n=1 Tax=Actinosynnema sp. NPDC020468 TaxID=3154488 RepID=UPI003402B5BD
MTRASGALIGLACGDALGAPTEFLTVAEIERRWGPGGPGDLEGDPALITDDTQMTLAVARALAELPPDAPVPAVVDALSRHFITWWAAPDNNRAPGMTCLNACERLAAGLPWPQATGASSKGCGANMRVLPVGLVPGLSDDRRAGLAQLQSAITHGHPTALAASELTAFAALWLARGMRPGDLLEALRARCAEQRTTYREEWLGELWARPGVTDPAEFIARGWDECAHALEVVATVPADRATDPCLATGAGWIAEEALATALHCFLLFPDEPVAAVRRAATTSGDSDSIACLAGAFAGAAHGLSAWPRDWVDRVEHSAELLAFGHAWDV